MEQNTNPEPRFSWVTLHVQEMERSLRFYRDFLGLSVANRMSPSPNAEIVFLGAGDTKVELIAEGSDALSAGTSPSATDGTKIGGGISVGFVVSEKLEETMARAQRAEIPITSEIIAPSQHIRFFFVTDPDRFLVQLVETSA
jgi:lactoylglutathione lyase